MRFYSRVLPCLLFEDDHLLVVNKPAGISTHAPGRFAGEGIYEWLRNREPRWAHLAIIHRLDKETSGALIFGKTSQANRSLTEQFTARTVRKIYVFLTDRVAQQSQFTVRSALVRCGQKYMSRPLHAGGEVAETRFRAGEGSLVQTRSNRTLRTMTAEPLTGRTHQIRVHAADKSVPILGDVLYGGTPAERVCLHAEQIEIEHPESRARMSFRAPIDFATDSSIAMRHAFIDPDITSAYRLMHGASDRWPGWYVDRAGEFLVSQSKSNLTQAQTDVLAHWMRFCGARGAYHKQLKQAPAKAGSADTSPRLITGEPATDRFVIRENGLSLELSFMEGYSFGLFFDQRDNRRRLLTGYIAPEFVIFPTSGTPDPPKVLNTFAYTCGFSVCAAVAGAHTTNVDLSRKYLDWGKRNFDLNKIDLAKHEFLAGDVFDWLRRLAKKARRFDLILLDPPSFSQSKESGTFQAQKHYSKLILAALRVLGPGGILFASSNLATWLPERFCEQIEGAVIEAGRRILQRQYVPQPPDFPVSRNEPAYLKTLWMRIA